MDYLKTVAVAVLNCKQNVSFIVFRSNVKNTQIMLSDVTVNIFHSHMTLYLNIMKLQGFYIRLFPFSQNRQGILSTRLYFHEPKDKCP